jgi:hypothetical protein
MLQRKSSELIWIPVALSSRRVSLVSSSVQAVKNNVEAETMN